MTALSSLATAFLAETISLSPLPVVKTTTVSDFETRFWVQALRRPAKGHN